MVLNCAIAMRIRTSLPILGALAAALTAEEVKK
jgi:hypothetical protein